MVETVSAIAVFSALSLSLWIGVSAAFKGTSLTTLTSRDAVGLLALQTEIETACARIQPPFWISSVDARIVDSQLRVPYLDGNADVELELWVSDGTITIKTGEERLQFPINGTWQLSLTEEAGSPVGFILSRTDLDGVKTCIGAAFGGLPIPVGRYE